MLGAAYLAVLVAFFATQGFVFPPAPVVQLTAGVITFLTVVQQAPAGADTPDLARFVPYSTGSVMFALEMLGWGFFIALAALFVAPLSSGGRLQLAIRSILIAFGVLSLTSVAGFISETPLTIAGFVAWGPLLLALAVLLSVYFSRRRRASTPPGHGPAPPPRPLP